MAEQGSGNQTPICYLTNHINTRISTNSWYVNMIMFKQRNFSGEPMPPRGAQTERNVNTQHRR